MLHAHADVKPHPHHRATRNEMADEATATMVSVQPPDLPGPRSPRRAARGTSRSSPTSSRARLLTPLDPRQSRARELVDVLRTAIIRGELVPGSIHSVASLASALGVSRTPVREALIELASRGMVRFERNRGVRILQNSVHDIEEIFDIRLLLEVPAVRRAVERVDRRELRALEAECNGMARAAEAGDEEALWRHDRAFHHRLLTLSGNRRLADYVDSLRDMVLLRGVTTAGRSRSLEDIVQEHRRILEAVAAGDTEGAAAAMEAHLRRTAELLIAQESAGLPGS
jgi:DNA-binding GntR family transcriptional regulator